jgi:hypothetical protein
MYRIGFKVIGYSIIFIVFDVVRYTLRCAIVYWFFWCVIEITLVVVLMFFSNRIRDNSGVEKSGRVEINSKVSDILDAWVEVFESITEFCIAGEEKDGIFGEKWEEKAELSTKVCESEVTICERVWIGVEYSIFFISKISCELLLLLLLLDLELLILVEEVFEYFRVFV